MGILLVAIHSVGSVGIGTIMAAVQVGSVLGLVTKAFGTWRDHLYYGRGIDRAGKNVRQVLKIKSVFGIMDWNRKERRHSDGSRKKTEW